MLRVTRRASIQTRRAEGQSLRRATAYDPPMNAAGSGKSPDPHSRRRTMLFSWWQAAHKNPGKSHRPKPQVTSRRYRPSLEVLENRWAPAVVRVTTTADDLTPNDGTVSL